MLPHLHHLYVHEKPSLGQSLNNIPVDCMGFEADGILRDKQKIMQFNLIADNKYSKQLYLEINSKYYSLLNSNFVLSTLYSFSRVSLGQKTLDGVSMSQLTCNFYRLI